MMRPDRDKWIDDARDEPIEKVCGNRGLKLKKVAVNELAGPCPQCGGTDRFSINTTKQVFNCRSCKKGGDVIDLVMFMDGTDFDGAVEKLTGKPPPKLNGYAAQPVVAGKWVYRDADDRRYLGIKRLDYPDGTKQYRQLHWDGTQWISGKPAGPKIPYRLPHLLDSDRSEPVYICEGEKCADAVAKLGLAATTASEGAGKWTPDLNEWFKDRIAWILPDNDAPGRNHAKLVAQNLAGIARDIRIVELPGLDEREDAFDWIKRGGTREQLDEIGDKAPKWSSQSDEQPKRIMQTIADFLAGYICPNYVVDGLLKRGFLYSLTAMTGAGKTAIALLIAEIASNRKRRRKLGPHEVEHVRVIYIACENADDVRARLIGMESRMDFDRADLDMLVIDSVFDLAKNMDRIRKEAEEFGGNIGLVIIDTSAAMFAGQDENNNPQMLAHAKLQRSLCDLPGRPCVLALNHPIKHATSPDQLLPRGGGAYINEIDGNLTAWTHGERLTTLHWTGKIRGPDFEAIEFRMPTIHTDKLADGKGRMLPTVMAEIISNKEIDEDEAKAAIQDDKICRQSSTGQMDQSPNGQLIAAGRACLLPARNRSPTSLSPIRCSSAW
jgi:AAA domain/CHC2 zinc finger